MPGKMFCIEELISQIPALQQQKKRADAAPADGSGAGDYLKRHNES